MQAVSFSSLSTENLAKESVQTELDSPQQAATKQLPEAERTLQKSLHDYGVTLYTDRETGGTVRLVDLNNTVCSPESRSDVWKPELFDLFDHWRSNYVSRKSHEYMTDAPDSARLEAEHILEGLLDDKIYPGFCSALGTRIINAITAAGGKLDFLDQPVPVKPAYNPISPDKIGATFDHVMTCLKKRYEKTSAKVPVSGLVPELIAACQYSDPVPERILDFPELEWLQLLRQALTEEALANGVNIDFFQTPFFFSFIEQVIANEATKATLFMEHPVSGNQTHGFISHSLQVVSNARMKRLNNEKLDRLVDSGLWARTIDYEPHLNTSDPVHLKHGADETLLVNFDTLMSGSYPDRFNTLLVFGLMSALLESKTGHAEGEQALISRYQLSVEAGETTEQTVKRHIRNIRALEYAVAGATFALGDETAKALGQHERRGDIKQLEDLYREEPEHCWGEFGDGMFENLHARMQVAMVCHYLKPDSGYHVYKAEGGKLKRVDSTTPYDKDGSYVVYPVAGRPPAHILV